MSIPSCNSGSHDKWQQLDNSLVADRHGTLPPHSQSMSSWILEFLMWHWPFLCVYLSQQRSHWILCCPRFQKNYFYQFTSKFMFKHSSVSGCNRDTSKLSYIYSLDFISYWIHYNDHTLYLYKVILLKVCGWKHFAKLTWKPHFHKYFSYLFVVLVFTFIQVLYAVASLSLVYSKIKTSLN